MLLPSALSCDSNSLPQQKPQLLQRPKLPAFERYDPRQRSHSPVVGLIASCRALHSILGERLSSTSTPPVDANPRSRLASSPFGQPSPPPIRVPVPRGINKRRRDEFESDEEEEKSILRQSTSRCYHDDMYSTPKRRRRAPLELPRGLLASDFESLANSTPRASDSAVKLDMPIPIPDLGSIPTVPSSQDAPRNRPPLAKGTKNTSWNESDDRILVETVLSKLSLSKREWNDCAKQLGTDKATLGKRWKMLLGGGNIGLRRGVGKMERTDLDIRSW